MRQLDENQIEELVSGGPNQLHWHPIAVSHIDLEKQQDLVVITPTTSSYVVKPTDDIVLADSGLGNITITLPHSTGKREFVVVKAHTLNTVTINFFGTENCLGQSSFSLTTLGSVYRFKAYNGNWIIF